MLGDGRRRVVGDAGASLVGIVLVLLVLGGMAALSVSVLDGQDPQGATAALGDATGGAPASLPEGTPAGSPSPVGLAGSVPSAACKVDVATIATALAAAQAAGLAPSTVDDLVTGGWLSEAPSRPGHAYALELADGRPTGRVSVNGRAADEGCGLAVANEKR